MERFDYSKIAYNYDEKRYTSRKNIYTHRSYNKCLYYLLPKNKAISILDVGCGTGRGVLFLSEEGYKVIGLDYTINMLRLCREKLLKVQPAKLIRGDAGALPFSDESIDCIISLNFLHLFSNEVQKGFIDEMTRVLKSRAMLICEFDNYYRGIFGGRQTLKNNPALHLNRPSDYEYIFSNKMLQIDRICGTSLPYMWRIFQYIPNIGACFDVLAYFWPFSLIAPRVIVKAIKC